MKVIFLDRDGVINKFPGNGKYVTKVKNFRFIPGSLQAIKRLTDAGFNIFVISNQAGVDKGIYSQKKLDQITRKMLKHVRQHGGKIRKVFYCTHRSDAGCDCRKPNIGSVRRSLKLLGKNMRLAQKAFFVGDTQSDIQAGRNAGCKTIFALSGREDRRYMRRWNGLRPDFIAKNLLEATDIVLLNGDSAKKHKSKISGITYRKKSSRAIGKKRT